MTLHVCTGALVCAMASAAVATDFPEVEPNNTKAQGTFVPGMMPGDTLSGTSNSSVGAGLDYFHLNVAGRTAGLYRNRLVINSLISGHVGTIRGLNQDNGVIGSSDFTAQSSAPGTLPPFYNQWYSFGASHDLHYRIAGTADTTQAYSVSFQSEEITPAFIGEFNVGMITISTVGLGHFTDTDIWVYDENFNAIPDYGNDNAKNLPGGVILGSSLTRFFAAGVYYLAISDANFANNLPSPEDDNNRDGVVLDFEGAALNATSLVGVDLTFAMGPAGSTLVPVPSTKLGAYDVNWYRFEVVPSPGTAGLLGLAGLAAVRRRR